MVVKTLSYEITYPTIDSQIVELKSSGADLLYDASTPKFAAMAIRKVADSDWHPIHIIDSNGASVKPALASVGFDKSKDVITAQYLKDPTDPGWDNDPGMKEFDAWRAKYSPTAIPRMLPGPMATPWRRRWFSCCNGQAMTCRGKAS